MHGTVHLLRRHTPPPHPPPKKCSSSSYVSEVVTRTREPLSSSLVDWCLKLFSSTVTNNPRFFTAGPICVRLRRWLRDPGWLQPFLFDFRWVIRPPNLLLLVTRPRSTFFIWPAFHNWWICPLKSPTSSDWIYWIQIELVTEEYLKKPLTNFHEFWSKRWKTEGRWQKPLIWFLTLIKPSIWSRRTRNDTMDDF